MKLVDFYERVLETTGLDVMTLGSLKAAIKNCMADLTSRGYRVFKEKNLTDLLITKEKLSIVIQDTVSTKELIPLTEIKIGDTFIVKDSDTYVCINPKGNTFDEIYQNITSLKNIVIETKGYIDPIMIEVDAPKDIRKILYCKVFFNNYAVVAKRYSLSNPRVACQFIKGKFRSSLQSNEAIFFIKGDKLIIEWHPALGNITDVAFGYYEKITTPEFDTNVSDVQNLRDVEIDIRPEFEDALVFYAAYFYYSRYVKDTDKIQLYLSNYKYYVEDISHELSYEDEYFEEDAVIRTEDLD